MSNTTIKLEVYERLERASIMQFTDSTSIWGLLKYRQKLARVLLSSAPNEEERKILHEAYDDCDIKICEALALPKPTKQ